MREEIWIDGFNLFYAWPETAPLLRGAGEIGSALAMCLRRLAAFLGSYRRRALVFLDGGLTSGFANIGGVGVRYAGPGRKADDLMRAHLGGDERRGRRITAVSNDRLLASSLKMFGVEIMTAEDFFALFGKKNRARSKAVADVRLLPSEVEAWVQIFSIPSEAPSADRHIFPQRRKDHG